MATKSRLSNKHFAIDKANTQIVVITAIAAFLTVFSLVASFSLWSEKGYQSRVISASETAHRQLVANTKAVSKLAATYSQFVNQQTNVIGGSSTGSNQNDGDNAKIILDALPSQYDFPALTSSVEKILNSYNASITSISGTDDELTQLTTVGSSTPKPVPMAFSFSITGVSYATLQQLLGTLQSSIRPIQVDTMTLTGASNNLTVNVTAHTYYQPQISLTSKSELVK